jgi:hypothetical protein
MASAALQIRARLASLLLCSWTTAMAEPSLYLIDDRRPAKSGGQAPRAWYLVTDGVMGGVSTGRMNRDVIEGRDCLRLQGEVRLENNGGFLQMALDLPADEMPDIPAYTGLMLEVYGNGEAYNVHLRTRDIWLPWQSYRARFQAGPEWAKVYIPFKDFEPYRIRKALDLTRLKRIGLVAIGRAFTADLCLAQIGLYRD